MALANNAPILLNQGASLLPAVKAYITASTGTVFIVGGTGVVPASIEAELNPWVRLLSASLAPTVRKRLRLLARRLARPVINCGSREP